MDVRVGLWRKLGAKKIDGFELWCWRRLLSPLDCKEIQPVHPKGDQSWVFIGRTDAEAETPILWPPHVKSWLIGKRSWCWERLKAGWEGDDRGWDGWMASPMRWTWLWVNSGSWWWTGWPGMLRFMGSQRVRHDWATEPNWTELIYNVVLISAVQQRDSVIYIYIFTYTHSFENILFHCDLSQDTEYSSLCYTVGPCFLSFLYM